MRLPPVVRRIDDPDELTAATRRTRLAVVVTVIAAFLVAVALIALGWKP